MNWSLYNCVLDSRLRGNDAPVVMPAHACPVRDTGSGHLVFCTGVVAYPGAYGASPLGDEPLFG